MKNDFLKTHIIFNDDDNEFYIGKNRKGKIILYPKRDLHISKFGYEMILEGRGKLSPFKKTKSKKVLLNTKTLLAGDQYEFDLDIEGELPGSYKGRNIQFNWKIKTFIELKEPSYSEVRNSLLKGLKLFKAYNPNEFLEEEMDIFVYQDPKSFTVQPQKKEFSSSVLPYWISFSIGILFAFFLYEKLSSPYNLWIAFLVGGLSFLFSVVSFYYKQRVIGQIFFEVNNGEENQLQLKLLLSKNHKAIEKIESNLLIIEKVVDTRGTSDSTYRHTIYRSKTKRKIRPNQNPNFVFEFPKKDFPASYKEGDISFLWEIEIKVFLPMGLKTKFAEQIEVSKVIDSP